MRTLQTILLGLVLCSASAQDQKKMFASIPCRVDADQVTFVYDEHNQVISGRVVRIATLKKTEARPSFEQLTAKERKRLQKQARRAHACEIFVINDYKRPTHAQFVTEEQEARMQQEIQFYMVQRTRPCPECPTAQN